MDITIFSSSPVQYLRWSSLWQKIGNSCKLLLTVTTKSFVLDVTGLLGPTLKHIHKIYIKAIEYLIPHLHIQTQQINTKNTSNILKFNNKDTRKTSGSSIVNFEHISQFILLLYCWIQTNKCQFSLRNYSFRQ